MVVIRAADEGTGTQPGGQGTGTNANPSTEPIPAVTNGSLEPGTYVIITTDPGFNASHQITIDVPAGYGGFNDGLAVFSTSLQTAGVGMWTADYSFSDACKWTGTRSAISSGDELVAALAGQQGLRPPPPTDVVVSGFAGTFIELTAPASRGSIVVPGNISGCGRTRMGEPSTSTTPVSTSSCGSWTSTANGS